MLAWLNQALPTLKKIQEPRNKPQPKIKAVPVAVPEEEVAPKLYTHPNQKMRLSPTQQHFHPVKLLDPALNLKE